MCAANLTLQFIHQTQRVSSFSTVIFSSDFPRSVGIE